MQMTEKESMTLEPLPVVLSHSPGYSQGFELDPQLGAGKGVKANNGFPSIVIKTTPRRPPGMRRGRKSKPTELGQAE